MSNKRIQSIIDLIYKSKNQMFFKRNLDYGERELFLRSKKASEDKDLFLDIRNNKYSVSIGDRDSSGKPVSEIQQLLLFNGYELPEHGVDGIFGKETRQAVEAFQSDYNLRQDGVVGPKTISKLSPAGSKELNFEDDSTFEPDSSSTISETEDLAERIGIDSVFLEAVLKVESNGNSKAIRFEPHIFNRIMKKKRRPERMPFSQENERAYSTIPEETNIDAFWKAYEIDKESAIRSTSFGRGQVMGNRLLDIERDPEKAVKLFFNVPDKMSDELIGAWFLKNPKAIDAANNLDFKRFAEIYNGPLYWQGKYDQKLKNAYNGLKNKGIS